MIRLDARLPFVLGIPHEGFVILAEGRPIQAMFRCAWRQYAYPEYWNTYSEPSLTMLLWINLVRKVNNA